MPEKKKGRKSITTSDATSEPITITNPITIAMCQALAKSQRKGVEKYLDDRIQHDYLYI